MCVCVLCVFHGEFLVHESHIFTYSSVPFYLGQGFISSCRNVPHELAVHLKNDKKHNWQRAQSWCRTWFIDSLIDSLMMQVLSFQSYLHGPMKAWDSHSGGIHPAMPQVGNNGLPLELLVCLRACLSMLLC